jgi:type I restriction enzyme S subunit
MTRVSTRVTTTGGREATTQHIPPKLALAVGMPSIAAAAGWRWSPLSSIARLESGHTPSRKHPEYWGGAIPWISIQDAREAHGRRIDSTLEHTNDVGIANSSARILPKDTVCLSRTASVGYVVVMGRPMATSQDFVNWVCTDQLSPDFLKYVFLAEGKDLLRFASGSVHQTIYFPAAKAFHICHPSAAEQGRIVAILDGAFEGIVIGKVNAEKNLQNAESLFSAGFGGLTSAAESKKWPRATVAEIASSRKGSIRTGPFGSQLLHSEFVNDGIAVLGIDNAVANEFRWGKARFITPEKYRQLERYRVFPGDVLITIMGTCGRCAIVPDTIPIAINTKHLCCITLDTSKCLPGYLHAYFLHHPLALEFLAKHAKGAIMAGLNMGLIEGLPVLLPPLERQRELIAALDRLKTETKRLASIYKRKIAALDTLKQSLLHHAFAGELTVSKTLELIEAVA